MAIESPHTAPNQVFGNYFRILRYSVECAPDELPRMVVHLGFYVSAYARTQNSSPPHTYTVVFTMAELEAAGVGDPRRELYNLLKGTQLFKGFNFSDDMVVRDTKMTPTLAVAKLRKRAEITAAKIKANRTSFTWNGHEFQADDASMLEIQTTMQGVLARGGLRADWPGGWRATNNDVVPIPDLDTWFDFFGAIEETGQRNYDYSHQLKDLVDAAVALNQINAIQWGMDPSLGLPPPVEDPVVEETPAITLSPTMTADHQLQLTDAPPPEPSWATPPTQPPEPEEPAPTYTEPEPPPPPSPLPDPQPEPEEPAPEPDPQA